MNSYFTQHANALRDAARRLVATPLNTLLALLVIGVALALPSAGYVALLHRLRDQKADEIVYAPEFRREIEEPIANAIPVFPETRLVITEGNYLLLDHGHWAGVSELLDEIWYVDIDHSVRRERLVKRHMHFGRSQSAAEDWVANTDEPNAVRIEATKHRADVLFNWEGE